MVGQSGVTGSDLRALSPPLGYGSEAGTRWDWRAGLKRAPGSSFPGTGMTILLLLASTSHGGPLAPIALPTSQHEIVAGVIVQSHTPIVVPSMGVLAPVGQTACAGTLYELVVREPVKGPAAGETVHMRWPGCFDEGGAVQNCTAEYCSLPRRGQHLLVFLTPSEAEPRQPGTWWPDEHVYLESDGEARDIRGATVVLRDGRMGLVWPAGGGTPVGSPQDVPVPWPELLRAAGAQ